MTRRPTIFLSVIALAGVLEPSLADGAIETRVALSMEERSPADFRRALADQAESFSEDAALVGEAINVPGVAAATPGQATAVMSFSGEFSKHIRTSSRGVTRDAGRLVDRPCSRRTT